MRKALKTVFAVLTLAALCALCATGASAQGLGPGGYPTFGFWADGGLYSGPGYATNMAPPSSGWAWGSVGWGSGWSGLGVAAGIGPTGTAGVSVKIPGTYDKFDLRF